MKKIEYCYLMTDGKRFKIGKSTDVKQRYATMKTSAPDLILLGYTDLFTEAEMHEKYKKYHYKLEWFEFDGDMVANVINDFRNVDTDFVIVYYKKYNMILEESTGKLVSYNATSYNLRNYDRFLSDSGKYKIGKFKFSNKDKMIKFFRGVLDELPLGEEIVDVDIIKAVEDMIKHHPSYDGFLETGYKMLKTKLDTNEFDSSKTTKRYSNFCFVFNDGTEWNFSNRKCFDNILPIKTISRAKKNNKLFNNDFILNFGKYKGKTIDEILIMDRDWLQWCYTNFKEFKEKIDSTKYKNILKINLNQV
jgi:hypothetical protein